MIPINRNENLTKKRLKQIVAHLPNSFQFELKRLHYRVQIARGTFNTLEPEYKILSNFIKAGDWVIDIGANVGHYTKRFSELVGVLGRVIAFEPVPSTFSLLAANTQLFTHNNVTLVNAAVSNKFDTIGMELPTCPTGLINYYRAQCSYSNECKFSVVTLPLDSLDINRRISLIKIDVEGHEVAVLSGMEKLLKSHHPLLIIETNEQEISDHLVALGYKEQRLKNSPNIIFKLF